MVNTLLPCSSHTPKVFYHSFQSQAKSWWRARRVVANIEWHAGEVLGLNPSGKSRSNRRNCRPVAGRPSRPRCRIAGTLWCHRYTGIPCTGGHEMLSPQTVA